MANKLLQINTVDLKDDYFNALPKNVQDILLALKGQENLCVKGGVAKLCLMAMLMTEGKLKDNARWQAQQKINDIDFIFIFPPEIRDLRERFIERYQKINNLLLAKDCHVQPKDINIIDAVSVKEGIRAILEANDLTINEETVVFDDGKWKIFFTPTAASHLAKGIGVLNPKPGHVWKSAGRIFPSSLGMIRLLKFLVRGNVDKIYLPKWRLDIYFQHYKKKVETGEWPEGATLIFYSLVFIKNYFGNNPELQNKAMAILCDLGFTPILDPQAYIKQQEGILENHKGELESNDLTIEEVFGRYLELKKRQEDNKTKRQANLVRCIHEYKTIECDLCGKNRCIIENCVKCERNKNPSPLPCTLRMWMGDLDPNDFYPIE